MSYGQSLPPLNALRAFDAAARHESFQRAAEELFITAGAVAHQIKQLEAATGLQLFLRHPRGISLTPLGRRYAETVHYVLDTLSAATQQLQSESGRENVVTISSISSFVTRWLMPRLSGFTRRHPEFEVRLQGVIKPADLFREPVDVSIRLGTGPYPDLKVDELFAEHFVAVASPRFLEEHPIRIPADLLQVTLLHDDFEPLISEQVNWKKWLTACGVTTPSKLPGLWFSHTYLTLEAAMAGQGVAIASAPMLNNALEIGALVTLLEDISVQGPYMYRMLRLPMAESRPAVKAFCEWMLESSVAAPSVLQE